MVEPASTNGSSSAYRTKPTATAQALELGVVNTSAFRGLLKFCLAVIYRDCYARQAALGLAQRFVHGGKEADGSPTRDRLKLMPRVVNVEEWARTAPLSGPVSLPTMHCPHGMSTQDCIGQRATNEVGMRHSWIWCKVQQLQGLHRDRYLITSTGRRGAAVQAGSIWVLELEVPGGGAQEVGLLRRYNDKPLLTRPQQKFFLTPTYLEIDLDIHNYAYLARKVVYRRGSSNREIEFDALLIVVRSTTSSTPDLCVGVLQSPLHGNASASTCGIFHICQHCSKVVSLPVQMRAVSPLDIRIRDCNG